MVPLVTTGQETAVCPASTATGNNTSVLAVQQTRGATLPSTGGGAAVLLPGLAAAAAAVVSRRLRRAA
jgi:hypothetical protein